MSQILIVLIVNVNKMNNKRGAVLTLGSYKIAATSNGHLYSCRTL